MGGFFDKENLVLILLLQLFKRKTEQKLLNILELSFWLLYKYIAYIVRFMETRSKHIKEQYRHAAGTQN